MPSAPPRRPVLLAVLATLAVAALLPARPAVAAPVTLGIDVLLATRPELVTGRRVGLVTNPAAVDGNLVPTLERLRSDGRVQITQLFAPEHGLAAVLPNGRSGSAGTDPETGLPVEGLFGSKRGPSPEALARVDVIVFDLQDIGSRTYTYVTSLGHMMQGAASAKVPLVVLDRPNPRGGLQFEGPIREARHKSLIGWGPLPVTHGMTIGEVARFYNGELRMGCDLTVVPMQGWQRAMTWEDTGLDWVPTSPGIPHALNAHLYVATGMVGGAGTNVNEGGGMSMPFELIGAPFVSPRALAAALEAEKLEGVRFRPMTFRPHRGQFAGKVVHGVQVILKDVKAFRPLRTALTILTVLRRLHAGEFRVHDRAKFARVWGKRAVLESIEAGRTAAEIEAAWAEELGAFGRQREQYLLYP